MRSSEADNAALPAPEASALPYARPIPQVEPEAAPFWASLREHRMRVQRCEDCGESYFPPSARCPSCLSDRVTWEQVSGRGRVWATATMFRAYLPAYEADIPYDVSIVELEEGAKVWSNVVDCHPDDVHVGMAVTVRYDDVTPALTLARFVPVER
jgi:uncharacterized OB-fold protein